MLSISVFSIIFNVSSAPANNATTTQSAPSTPEPAAATADTSDVPF